MKNIIHNLPPANLASVVTDGSDGLLDLVDLLETIDLNGPLSPANETTISDNNGGRIEL